MDRQTKTELDYKMFASPDLFCLFNFNVIFTKFSLNYGNVKKKKIDKASICAIWLQNRIWPPILGEFNVSSH